jgi:hypothetical protein
MNKLNQDGKLFHIFLTVVTGLSLLANSPMIMDVAIATQGENQGNFIIRVTPVDDSDNDIDLVFSDIVDIYVKEHPEYGHFNIDLSDALYSDTSNGEYTTDIVMPSGVIEVNETFHICIEGSVTDGGNGMICYNLLNKPQQGPEEITIRV